MQCETRKGVYLKHAKAFMQFARQKTRTDGGAASLIDFVAKKGQRVLHTFLVLTFVGLCAVTLHYFFQFVGSAPYLSTDDALVNISFNLSHLGRFGIPSGPVQAGNLSLRLDGFHNYGPWYFYVGAALSWLFGMSHEMQRAIHPFGILLIGALAFFSLRRVSLAAAGITAATLAYIFFYNHWPMVRPDIMVSVLAAMGFVSAAAAVRTDRLRWWFGAAFFFAAAVSQHMIAWALAPGMILVWALVQFLRPHLQDPPLPDGFAVSPRRASVGSFLAASMGALLALTVHLYAIEFRIADVITHLANYRKITNVGDAGGFIAVAGKHYLSAWGGVPGWLNISILAGFSLALLFLAGLRWVPRPDRRLVLAFLLPPVVVAIGYQLSLGFYGNWHAGYTILSQVATVWSAGAAVAIIVHFAGRRMKRWRWLPESVFSVVVIAGMVAEGQAFIKRPSNMQLAAGKWVNIEDYVDNALSPLPLRARAWGSFFFGLESGVRTDLLQLSDGMHLIQKIKPEKRASYAPEYLVIGYREQNDIAALLVKNSRAAHFYSQLQKVLPGQRYELIQIVTAPPYGPTRIYRRVSPKSAPVSAPPAVRVNNGTSRQWISRLLPAVTVVFRNTDPVSFDLPYAGGLFKESTGGRSARPQVADLDRGVYLVTVDITRDPKKGSGVLIATNTPSFTGSQTELGYGFVPAPYFPAEKTVYLLVAHGGGPLYISQFDSDPQAAFSITEVRSVEAYQPPTQITQLPPFKEWIIFSKSTKVLNQTPETFEMIGDASPWKYQVSSPAIKITPQSAVTLILPIKVKTGKLGIGVLDAKGNWLLAPQSGTNLISFNTLGNDRISIVVANNNYDGANGPVNFSLSRGSIEIGRSMGNKTYADELSLCHRSKKFLNPKDCL
ncbi:MAG: hypothetical protein CMM60_09405 [Rhodospirillaceae bacterium]|nr:hypothetical protein [Rhodospirillaceae bacterium]